jgi:putative salt-induced outer membrane protein YdiY
MVGTVGFVVGYGSAFINGGENNLDFAFGSCLRRAKRFKSVKGSDGFDVVNGDNMMFATDESNFDEREKRRVSFDIH